MMSISDRRAAVLTAFEKRYHARPTVWARAPGRVDLMGSHTDYNLGHVLTLPIGRDTWIAAMPGADRRVRLYSLNLEDEVRFGLDRIEPASSRHWSDYPRGVARVLGDEGHALVGFDGVLHGTVPIGSGLSSSAALECVTATVFEALGGWHLDPVEKAKHCQRAENQFVGVNCGILDQFTSCLGREGCALLLDCRDLTSRPVQIAAGIRVVICDTRAKRELAGSEYGERRADCEQGAALLGVAALRDVSLEAFGSSESSLPARVARRCRFIIEENARVLRLAEALVAGDRSSIGSLCASSFDGASRLYEIGAPAMDAMMAAMRSAPGVIGARQAGAGFGGCMVAFVEARAVDSFALSVQDAYHLATGLVPEVDPVAAAAGAGLMQP
jgi:galactokinase